MGMQGHSLQRLLMFSFGGLLTVATIAYAAVALTSVWQNEVRTAGESSRYAAKYIAASVARPAAAADAAAVANRLRPIRDEARHSTTCIYAASNAVLLTLGNATCPAKPGQPMADHLLASHPIRWQEARAGVVVIYVPYAVIRQQLGLFVVPILLVFLGGLIITLWLTRQLADRASRGAMELVTQLEQGDDQPLRLSEPATAPSEFKKLTQALNQRMASLIDARNAAELQAQRREAVELAERRARQLIRNIIDLVPYIIFAQRSDGSLVFANLATATLYDTSVETLMDPAFLRSTEVEDGLVFAKESAAPQAEIVFGSQRRRLHVTRVPFQERHATLVIAIDVTEARRLQTQLQFAQRLEVVGTLAGGIAHDFNNLLTPILGYASLLSDQDLPADTLKKVRAIETAAEKARSVVQQMLAFSRQEQSEHRPVDLNDLLADVASLMRVSAPATVQIVVDADQLPRVLADPTQLEQVLVNLCTNAVQAIGAGAGRIELRARMTEEPSTGSSLPAGRYANIEVVDSGPGIAPDVIQHVFEPFFTTKAVGEGSGLGLSVAHGIVRNHGGELLVNNRPGAGAAFTILLPEQPHQQPPTLVA